jgi:hypothetical protein
MNDKRLMRAAAVLGLLLLWGGAAGTSRAGFSYLVTVDTSPLAGQPGIVSFEFNPGLGTYQSATAQISGFATDGTLMGDTALFGGASGNLNPSPPASPQLLLDNSTTFNDGDQALTYGSTLTFRLTLSGDAVNSPGSADSGTTFSLFLQDPSLNPLLTNNPAGSVLDTDIPAGSNAVTSTSFATSPGGAMIVPEATAAPAPASLPLALVGLGLLAARRWYGRVRNRAGVGSGQRLP